MDLLFFIAKIIIAILPFLNRKSELKGKWNAEYISASTKEKLIERVQLNQLLSLVWGTIEPVTNPNDPIWTCYGLNRDQVFVGIYFSRERLGHWQGSFTLKFKNQRKNELIGQYQGFEEELQQIIGSPYTWTKLNI